MKELERKRLTPQDRELKEWVEKSRPKIKVVGTGGAGNNTITRLLEAGIEGAETIAINTDAMDLLCTDAHKKVLIGKSLTKGLGAGGNPQLGMEAAQESKEEIKEALDGANMVFLTAGCGGGTGSGSLPIIAEIAKRLDALVVGVVTLPFSMEGGERMRIARETIDKLRPLVNTLLVIPNDRLLEIAPKLSLVEAFRLCDEILVNAVKGVTELITKPGIIHRDFADVKALLSDGGLAMIGLGESDSENRAVDVVKKAINNPLLTVEIDGAKGALIHLMSGPELKVSEARQIIESISSRLSPDAQVLWGTLIDERLGNRVKVMLILTGIKSPQIFGPGDTSRRERKRIEKALKIKFVE